MGSCGKDQSRALLTIVKTDAEGNMLPVHTKVCGLAEDKLYRCSLDQEVRLGRTWNRAGLTLHQVLGEYESSPGRIYRSKIKKDKKKSSTGFERKGTQSGWRFFCIKKIKAGGKERTLYSAKIVMIQ